MWLSVPSFHKEEENQEMHIYVWAMGKEEAAGMCSPIADSLDFHISLIEE